MFRYVLIVALLAGVTACVAASPSHPSASDGIDVAAAAIKRQSAHTEIIEKFAELAARGDVDALIELVAPAAVAARGEAALRTLIQDEVVPFFSDYEALGGSGVAGAQFPDGRIGLAYYTYSATKSGGLKPFSIWLLEEDDGSTRIGVFEVGRCVRGRHPICDPTLGGLLLRGIAAGVRGVVLFPAYFPAYVSALYATELGPIRRAANTGDARAQVLMGWMFSSGLRHDQEKAVEWFRKAAEQGDATGQEELARAYERGFGVEKDIKQAEFWYLKAAEQGDLTAQWWLAYAYATDRGVERDDQAALRWMRLAVRSPDRWPKPTTQPQPAEAEETFGGVFARGGHVPKNEARAAYWYRIAAEQGNGRAQLALGMMYSEGRGVSKDQAEAKRWLELAAAQGDAKAREALKTLEPKPKPSP